MGGSEPKNAGGMKRFREVAGLVTNHVSIFNIIPLLFSNSPLENYLYQ